MADSNGNKTGLWAAKATLCLVTLLMAMPAEARTPSPLAEARTQCLRGGKLTADQRIDGCSALITAKGTRKKDLAGAYLTRGADYLGKNDIDRAIADFNELIRLDPKFYGAFTNRGEAWRRKGEVISAIADLDRAVALNPRDSIAWFNRGITHSDKGEPEKAISDYNQAIRLKPRDAWYYNNRGNSYGDINDFEHALADYNKAIMLDPKFALAYFNRGTAYRNRGFDTPALDDLNSSLRLDPSYGAAYGNPAVPGQRQDRSCARRLRPLAAAGAQRISRRLCARQHSFRPSRLPAGARRL